MLLKLFPRSKMMARGRSFAAINYFYRSFSSNNLPSGASLLNMPALSPTMTAGSVSSWSIGEGDSFAAGDVICEVETDKATVDLEALDDGFLGKILVSKDHKEIAVGDPIAVVTETEDALEEVSKQNFSFSDFVQTETKAINDTKTEEPQAEAANAKVRSSPAAGLLIQNLKLDSSLIKGSGKHGIITKGDVINASKGNQVHDTQTIHQHSSITKTVQETAVPQQTSESSFGQVESYDSGFSDVPLSNMRKVISARMVESKAASSHSYLSIACELDEAMTLRKKVKSKLGSTYSFNDLVILASARSLSDVPSINTNAKPGDEGVDVCVAVATEQGLITPIVKKAGGKSLMQINAEMKELAMKARNNKLMPEEYQGGNFTVSNLGMLGISNFTAIINQPQGAILAVGTSKPKLRRKEGVLSGGPWSKNEVEIRNEMVVTLSFDRKKIPESDAAQFLQCFKHYVSSPFLL